VKPKALVTGQQLRDLALPDGVLVTLILRGRQVVMPRGATALEPGDHVFLALRSKLQPLIDRLFDPDPDPPLLPEDLQLAFNATTTVEQLHRFFGLPLPDVGSSYDPARSLGSLLADARESRAVRFGAFGIQVGTDDDHVTVRCLADVA
jgi:cell volume regulation protein A